MSQDSSNPQDFLHNHTRRSQLVYKLITTRAVNPICKHETGIPKKFVQFWDDFANLPEDVRRCMDSWAGLISLGFDCSTFDHFQSRNFISNTYSREHLTAYDRCHHPAMQCDYFRLCYLLKHGGAYVDADECHVGHVDFEGLFRSGDLKLQPLCFDTSTGQMVPAETFANEAYQRDRIYYFNNNPIVTPKGHPVVELALKRATNKLLASLTPQDIQSTTGPGNITESLLLWYVDQETHASHETMFRPLFEWDDVNGR